MAGAKRSGAPVSVNSWGTASPCPSHALSYTLFIYHITLEEADRVRRELGIRELADARQLPVEGYREFEAGR